jgi:hypothetical protein
MPRRAAGAMDGPMAADFCLIREVAEWMIRAGRWQSIDRISDLFCDYFEVRLPDAGHSRLIFGLLHGRHYFYMDDRTSVIYVGETAAQVFERAGVPLPNRGGAFGRRQSRPAENPAPGVTERQ